MKFLLAVIVAALSSCAHTQPTPTSADAGGPITCAAVCDHGSALGCLWAQPTPKGHSCEAVCLNDGQAGQPWALDCLQRLQTCDSEAACR